MAAPGENECLEWLEVAVARINRVLQLGDAIVADARFCQMLLHFFGIGRCEKCSDAEKVALDWNEYLVHLRHDLGGAGQSNESIQLIDVAVSFDACVIFGDTAATEQTGEAFVAGL